MSVARCALLGGNLFVCTLYPAWRWAFFLWLLARAKLTLLYLASAVETFQKQNPFAPFFYPRLFGVGTTKLMGWCAIDRKHFALAASHAIRSSRQTDTRGRHTRRLWTPKPLRIALLFSRRTSNQFENIGVSPASFERAHHVAFKVFVEREEFVLIHLTLSASIRSTQNRRPKCAGMFFVSLAGPLTRRRLAVTSPRLRCNCGVVIRS
jgi:hypothetical protein